jgi:hypothetical protein
MMPNERRIKLNKAPFIQRKGAIMPNTRLRMLNARPRKPNEGPFA